VPLDRKAGITGRLVREKIHDDTTKRVSGIDKIVEESTLEELQAIPLYDKCEGVFRTDLRLPTLQDYLSICMRYEKKAVLEFKNRLEYKHIASIVELIKEMDYLEQVVFISFDWDNLMDLREILPEQPVQFLTGKVDNELLDRLIAHRIELDAWHNCLTKEVVEVLHKNGRTVNCWTVDEPDVASKMIELGVDYITTDILEGCNNTAIK